MAKVNTINAKELSSEVASDFDIECKEKVESITVRLPTNMATKLKQLKEDLKAKGHRVTISDLVKSALQKVFNA